MPDNILILKMRILICFLRMSKENCTVTNLAKTLVCEKYAVSRAMIALEKEGLLDRTNPRHPILTQSGAVIAGKYADRMDIATNYLIYEGVTEHKAREDAMYFTLYCSDETFDVIQGIEEKYRIKHLFREHESFNGALLCKTLRDGCYQLPFIIYRETVKDGNHISMANEGFGHPCSLNVMNGNGIISLTARNVTGNSAANGKRMNGKISSLKYWNQKKYCEVERNGDIFSFPAEVLQFVTIGSDTSRVLHGSVCLKMTCSVGRIHMPESTAIFTILI